MSRADSSFTFVPVRRGLVAAAGAARVAASLTLVTTGPPAASATPEAPGTQPSAEVTPVQVTGDPAESLNLIVLGDGYTADELDEFRADVDKHLNILWSIDPFRSYRNYVN